MSKSVRQNEKTRPDKSSKSAADKRRQEDWLDDEDWREAAREYGIEIILNRIRSDLDLRKRVRKLLAELPADSPGKTSSIPEKFIIKAVELLVASGVSYEEAYRRLSQEGVTAEAIRRRYFRSKKRAEK